MHVLLIRHGHPEREIRTEGVADPGLSPLGRWQAERLEHWLAHEPIDHLVASPKRRALETIEPLRSTLDLPVQIVADFDEIDRRASVYLPTELLPTEGGAYWEAVKRQDWDAAGWDPPDVFAERVETAFRVLCEHRPGERVAVACHGGVIRFILRSLFGADRQVRVQADYASITRLDVDRDGGVSIVSINETGHFDAWREGITGPMRDGNAPTLRF